MGDAYPLAPQVLVQRLSEAGYAPAKLETMLHGRISYRALYRWRNGEAMPQRSADYGAVYELAEALGVDLTPAALPEKAMEGGKDPAP